MPTPTWTSDRGIRVEADSPAHARSIADAVRRASPAWLADAVPSSGSVLIIIRPLAAPPDSIVGDLTRLIPAAGSGDDTSPGDPLRTVIIPACYDPSLAADLEPAAAELGLGIDELVGLHASAAYTADTLGFSPGFAYLTGLDDRLRLPRHATPRPRVPAGSVAIADDLTAVYPHATPGGWRLIARTPLEMFDARRDPPPLIEPGDTVRFQPIPLNEYRRLCDGGGAC
jgi:KipI family sensor histidine kinase inhibitor